MALEESAQLVSQERLDQREEQEGSVGLEGQEAQVVSAQQG